MNINIDIAVAALISVFTAALSLVPRFKVNGGSIRENLALQNVQVRENIFYVLCTQFIYTYVFYLIDSL